MVGYKGKGVSGWLSLAAAYALKVWAQICRDAGQTEHVALYEEQAAAFNAAVNQYLWDGNWYGRGITDDNVVFGISKDTLYRLIHKGTISHINLGTNQIRVSKEELLKLYPLRKKALTKPKPVAKLYSLEPKDCYTIGEISKKFHLEDSTVYLHIRKYSIPTRQIGNFVYVPKKEIDNLYKGMKQ